MVFGTNSYTLKSYTACELGINPTEGPDLCIQYRQEYLHIFFIPFYPGDRFWAVNIDGKLHEPSGELITIVNGLNASTKKGIWAFTGLLIAAFIVGCYILNNAVQVALNKGRSEIINLPEVSTPIKDTPFKSSVNTKPALQK